MERDTASLVTGKKGGRGKLRDFMKKKNGSRDERAVFDRWTERWECGPRCTQVKSSR